MKNYELAFFQSQIDKVKDYNTYSDNNSYYYFRILKTFQSDKQVPWEGENFKIGGILETDSSAGTKEISDIDDTLLNNFLLRFYIPIDALSRRSSNGEDTKIEHMVIMVNGLDENASFFKQYDFLGSSFAEKNIASVLLSTPFHLHRPAKRRFKDTNEEQVIKPSDVIWNDWRNVFSHYLKTYHDILKLTALIKQEIEDPDDLNFYKNHFSKNIKISLLGYSLGGLISFGCFLDTYEKRIFNKLVLFNAPGDLQKAKSKIIRINDAIWRKVCGDLRHSDMKMQIRTKENTSHENFITLFASEKAPTEFKSTIERTKSFILQIICGDDKVIDKEPWDEYFTQEEGGLKKTLISQHIFSGIGHSPMLESRGSEMMPQIVGIISDHVLFDETGHWQEKDISREIKVLLSKATDFKTELEKNLKDPQFPKTFTRANLMDLLKEIKEKEISAGSTLEFAEEKKNNFLKFYSLSKIYYPKFYEFLETIF